MNLFLGDMMTRALVHDFGKHRLEMAGDDHVKLGGKRKRMDHVLVQLLHLVIEAAHGCVTHDSIRSLLVKNNRSASSIYKLIGDLDEWCEHHDLPELIENERQRGYCLVDEWQVEAADDPVIEEALGEIRQIVDDTVRHMRGLPYKQSASGLQYVAKSDGIAQASFNRFHVSAWKLMHALAVHPKASAALIIQLKNALLTMMSYVTFWRLGTRYEELEWKDEFEKELKAALDVVELLVKHIMAD